MAIDLEKNHGVFIHEGVFNELQDQVTDIDNRVNRNTEELQEHTQKIAENLEKINENKAQLAEHETKIAENKQAIDETKQHLDEVQADLEQKIANEHAFTEQEIAGVRTELTNAKNELNERIDREVNDLNATIDSTKQALQSSIDALAETEQQDKAELEDKIEANQDSINDLGTRVKALEDFKTEITGTINTNTNDINQLKNQVSTLAGDAQRLSTQLDTTNQQLSTLSSLVDQTRDDLQSAKTELDDKIAAIVDHDTYVVSGEVNDNDLTLVQNDDTKNVVIELPDYKTTDTYITSAQVNDDKLELLQSDPTKNIEVQLPKQFDPTELLEQIAEQEHLREIENAVVDAQFNTAYSNGGIKIRANKFGGRLYFSPMVVSEGLSILNELSNVERTGNNFDADVPQFVNTLTGEYYGVENVEFFDRINDSMKHPEVHGINYVGVYIKDNEHSNNKQVITVAPTGTVLFQVGQHQAYSGYNILGAYLFNFAIDGDISSMPVDDNATNLNDVEFLKQFKQDRDGYYVIPLKYDPTKTTFNVTEVDVSGVVMDQFVNLNPRFEVRAYELTYVEPL